MRICSFVAALSALVWLTTSKSRSTAFVVVCNRAASSSTRWVTSDDTALPANSPDSDENSKKAVPAQVPSRRTLLSSLITVGGGALLLATTPRPALAVEQEGESESFASIAARAGRISKELGGSEPRDLPSYIQPTDKSAYDFSLPVAGVQTPFKDVIRQEFSSRTSGIDSSKTVDDAKVKAILVVNIKQDDPVARKTIPELISLAAKYGRGSEGSFAIVACPTDQGYFEPDTSQLIRLKLASEYGYGINPSTVVTDKVNFLGTGAHPFWRWLQSTCRTPAGLGRIQGNFEKFLLDGRTGLPLRRYPRKYKPLNIADDIEAVIAGKPLPPARANWQEEWRSAAAEAERDTYRFEKGLNYFDQ
jgi:glutathione peroxidase